MEKFIETAHYMADESRILANKYFRSPELRETFKADASPVTIADKQIEVRMREVIRTNFPDHGILGEEGGAEGIDSDYVWVLDPIDGTRNFIMGRPFFGVLISLLQNRKPVLGLIDQPYVGDRWFAAGDKPTSFNGTPVKVRKEISLADVRLLSSSPDIFDSENARRFEMIKRAVLFTHWETECCGYGLLAMGLVDVIIEKYLKPHDFCALKTIVENAGGIITDFRGYPLTLESDGNVLAAGDPIIHNQILAML